MNTKKLDRFPTIAAVVLIVLGFAACTIHLRGDEDQISPSMSADQAADPPAQKLAQCRSVTYEQKDALAECRKAWAEQRRQFLRRQAPPASAGSEASRQGSPLFVPPKDESQGIPPIPQSKE
jgi:conjugative transfer region protein TrbK